MSDGSIPDSNIFTVDVTGSPMSLTIYSNNIVNDAVIYEFKVSVVYDSY